jgi:hypothetical protein
MKKSKNLVIILALAAGFIALLVWNEQQTPGIDTSGPKPQGTEKLRLRLDSLGKEHYDEAAYKALKIDIGASQMAEVISHDEMVLLLASLEDKVAAAMVVSFDQWLANDCGTLSEEINSLVSLMKNQNTAVNSTDLENRLNIYSNFKVFLANKISVDQFLSGRYTESGANNLKAKIDKNLGLEGVSNCSSMSSKKNEWKNEIAEFKKNQDAYEAIISNSGPASDGACEKYKRYKYYYNQLLILNKCYLN